MNKRNVVLGIGVLLLVSACSSTGFSEWTSTPLKDITVGTALAMLVIHALFTSK